MNDRISATETAAQSVSLAVQDLVAALPRIEQALQSGAGDAEAIGAAVMDLAAGVMDACVVFGDAGISASLLGLASATYQLATAIAPSDDTTMRERLLDAMKQMQEAQMSFNLQYLQLRSQMQNENRSYTAVSNIMKTKHDTVKNSISNIR
jgi:arginine decarboxylase-like protein